jgi:hypothetical protein
MPSALTAADDELHRPRPDDPTWAETAWFAASIPERGICIWLYPLFRPNLGVMSFAAYVFGPGGRELWQQPYYRLYWHEPMPAGLRLTDFELPIGLSYKTLAPLSSYRLSYDDGEAMSVSMTFEALHAPHELGIDGERGHIDQFGRVRGELVLHGERMEIDCIEMRDRTWSPRREHRDGTWLTYSYGAASETSAFHCATKPRQDGTSALLGGFVIREGQVRQLVAGERAAIRDADGRPLTLSVSVEDDSGDTAEIRGEVVSQMAMHTSPYFVWVSLVRWTLPDGSTAWGEDQDTWSPGRLRSLRRELAEQPSAPSPPTLVGS